MLDREKIETVLSRRFPDATAGQIAAAANAIMGLGEEWEEVVDQDGEPVDELPDRFAGICGVTREVEPVGACRIFRRRES